MESRSADNIVDYIGVYEALNICPAAFVSASYSYPRYRLTRMATIVIGFPEDYCLTVPKRRNVTPEYQ